ncbi:InlB B-repeat-containing protein [Aurantimicrobium minutum]|uniref:InlB B-repeat-containing protein n=1 Tax=Aurantimicrobium minutum TaxID=708131 RepID=UPI002474CC05|nr:InlB B-repeat-containing protein [Aurantimicrobium minutum]MDH6537320.1 putative repeat protein (TIGR02543 family) [Aurantimicrobium minutum]
MKNFSLKALGAIIFAAGLVVAGVAAPAQAATVTNYSATTTSTLVANQVIADPITVTFTAPTAIAADMNTQVRVTFLGASGFGSDRACGSDVTFTASPSVTADCRMTYNANSGNSFAYLMATGQPGIAITANTVFTFTIAGGLLTMPASGPLSIDVKTYNAGSNTTVDSGSTSLSASSSNSTVSYNANNGAGVMADQVASTATALTSNAFTRSGYTFAGWSTSADGSGTAYADGASYAFTSSTTLYAQWTATLANTGINSATGISLLAGGMSLALVGAEIFMIARRKRSN